MGGQFNETKIVVKAGEILASNFCTQWPVLETCLTVNNFNLALKAFAEKYFFKKTKICETCLTNIFEFVKSIGAMLRSFTWPASLSVIKLNVIRLNVKMLSVIKLSVIKLDVVLLSVVAPLKRTASISKI